MAHPQEANSDLKLQLLFDHINCCVCMRVICHSNHTCPQQQPRLELVGKKGNDSWDLLNRDVDEVDVGSPPSLPLLLRLGVKKTSLCESSFFNSFKTSGTSNSFLAFVVYLCHKIWLEFHSKLISHIPHWNARWNI